MYLRRELQVSRHIYFFNFQTNYPQPPVPSSLQPSGMKLSFRGKRRETYIPFYNDTFKPLFSQGFQAYLGVLYKYTVAGRFFHCFFSVMSQSMREHTILWNEILELIMDDIPPPIPVKPVRLMHRLRYLIREIK